MYVNFDPVKYICQGVSYAIRLVCVSLLLAVCPRAGLLQK